MATISVSLPSDGTTADVSDINTPITTIVNEINGNLDNANIKAGAAIDGTKLADGAIETAKIDDGAVTPAKLATGAATALVATSQTTTSTTFTDLATVGPSVTVTIGANGLALVSIYSFLQHLVASGNSAVVSFAVSGANTQAAADNYAINLQTWTANAFGQYGATFLLTGLSSGSTTFTMKYRGTSANTSTFASRRIAVIPL